MPQPTASDVHVNRPLTNVSEAFLQDLTGFVARKVFPVVPVSKQSDRYFKYDKKQWFRTDAKVRAPSTESAGSGFTIDNTPTYFAKVVALHKDVDDQIRANSDAPINPDNDATEFVTRQLMLQQEQDWAAKYFTTGVWTGSTTGTDVTPGVLWDVPATSNPIEDLRAQITAVGRNSGLEANTLVLGKEVWDVLQDHPDFLERIKFTQTAIVAPDLLAAVLGLDRVLVAKAVQDTAAEGAAASHAFVHGKNALVTYSAPRPSLMKPSGGYTFAWTGLLGANSSGMRIKRFRMVELSSDRIEGESAYDHKVVSPEAGAFLSAVIS